MADSAKAIILYISGYGLGLSCLSLSCPCINDKRKWGGGGKQCNKHLENGKTSPEKKEVLIVKKKKKIKEDNNTAELLNYCLYCNVDQLGRNKRGN